MQNFASSLFKMNNPTSLQIAAPLYQPIVTSNIVSLPMFYLGGKVRTYKCMFDNSSMVIRDWCNSFRPTNNFEELFGN
jgi:hypothetical protein